MPAFNLKLAPNLAQAFAPPSKAIRPAFPQLTPGAYVHPAIAKLAQPDLMNNVAAASQIQAAAQAAQVGSAPPDMSIEDLLDIEKEMYLNPEDTLRRFFRVYLCPGTIAGGVITFSPQRRCVPIRLLVASGTAGVVTGLQAGVEQYFAAAGSVPAACYSELAEQTGWLRPIICDVGNTVTATTTIANGTAIGLFCFDLSEKGMVSPPMGKPRAIGFSQSIPATGNATILLNPQKDFRLRRLALDQTVTNFASLTVTGLTVANDPQTEAVGSLPAQMFACNALEAMIDGDVCRVGAQIAITVANSNAAPVTAQGEVWGDSAD